MFVRVSSACARVRACLSVFSPGFKIILSALHTTSILIRHEHFHPRYNSRLIANNEHFLIAHQGVDEKLEEEDYSFHKPSRVLLPFLMKDQAASTWVNEVTTAFIPSEKPPRCRALFNLLESWYGFG